MRIQTVLTALATSALLFLPTAYASDWSDLISINPHTRAELVPLLTDQACIRATEYCAVKGNFGDNGFWSLDTYCINATNACGELETSEPGYVFAFYPDYGYPNDGALDDVNDWLKSGK